ncbi:TonB-dependent receptor [Rhodohalobacter sp. 614A]|uniref:TonB-dependent receptor n=1 Tax=Rhodohalobacter sp. 614A TaxID=2908649 RepID=UPI001F412945|nr:carboxypeptidase regulatory-like domain-containing protein [Rhodohalobacter sp. 614A]
MTRQILLIISLMLLLPLTLLAQGTTSGSIEGTITDETGEGLPGANIIAVHLPTGSEYGTSSRVDGGYTIRNVRVGGPYEVRVTFIGFNPQIKEVSNIELGERISLNFQLEEGSLELGQISVVAVPDQIFNSDRTGASTNISSEDIARTPSVARSLGDFTRLTPQVTGGNSFGGANDRYNNILVDGATLNDVFGLGDATPGSQAGVGSPLSIDAIAEFNVDIAPFDVTNSGFTGGQINAITKSGTNDYTGSVYFQTRNQNLIGNFEIDGESSDDYPDFTERYIGLNIGGPIVKDKLFFFVNGEFKRETSPITGGILNSGAPNEVDFESSTFDEISSILQNQYGYDPGGYSSPLDTDTNNNKLLAKLDWNINQSNKLSLRYNYVDAIANRGISRGTSSFTFSNRQYDFNSSQNSIVAELTSTLSNNAYNEARVVYTRIRDSRDVPSQRFPSVTVSIPYDSDRSGFGTINAGVEQYSQANSLDQDLIEITNNFTYISGEHEFTLGTSNQIFAFDNLFARNAFGAYTFRSIEDLASGSPYDYELSYLLEDGNPTANFTGMQFGLYVQDKWSVTNDLKVTYGLRVDVPILPDTPNNNPLVPSAFPGYSTTNVASGNLLWSPRLGFNWDASGGAKTTQIRGGVGIFSGTPPFVWISNQYSNTGVDYGRVDVSGGFDGLFSPDPDNQPRPGDHPALEPINTTEVNLIDEDFKYPQSLKVNLAVDQELPWGVVATLEGVYSSAINDVAFSNINLNQEGTSMYGRPIYGDIVFTERYGNASGYPSRRDANFTDAILLSNTDKGYQYSITGELEKRFDSGLYAKAAYTWNRAKNVNNGTSSQARSNWVYNENVDVNAPELGTADFERRHRILGVLSYRAAYANRFATTISVIYDGRSGTPYSWIYSGDANGDGQYDNDLIYVPASAGEVVLASDNWNEFDAWIESESSLSDARGGHVERNTAREDWTNYLDFKVTQEIETFGGQSIELSASVINALNLLNSEWGVRKGVSYNNHQAIYFQQYVDQDFINENPEYGLSSSDIGKPVISFDPEEQLDDNKFEVSDFTSRWQMQFSVRYNF